MNPTHYAILEVAEHASAEVIHAAWRTLSKRHHTDVAGPNDQIRLINHAHDILSDADKRAAYNGELAKFRMDQARQAATPERHAGFGYPAAYGTASSDDVVVEFVSNLGSAVMNQMLNQVPPPFRDQMRSYMSKGARRR